ncbi:uncharacterized protein LOC112556761 isoform X1 [Pomacea canaliculata]|uniref:uncharacterized protein LOC112556761 isoform X1 n=1 Tax=Pomacea canaliculata TaxID=400727 RepID=UPI000D72AB78|nr:uncharacterized protein LOC112556761 isoform X1 [Pomacea canaliculata]
MQIKMAKFRWLMLAILSLLVLGGLIVNFARWSFVLTPFMTATNIIPEPEVIEPLQVYCKDVLKLMVYGQWETRNLSAAESNEMKLFNDKVRKEKKIPTNLQRPDKLCGNVTFPNVVYRALCDPNGDTPCCYNNVCTNKTQHQCTCANCYDTRRPIDAEYATWRPSDPTCQLRHLSHNEICELLDGATLYFIGDSFVRHVFTAFLLAARNNETHGAMGPRTPPELQTSCAGLYMFTEKVCRLHVDSDTTVCNERVKVKLVDDYRLDSVAAAVHTAIINLSNVSRSIVFMSFGIHDHFEVEKVRQKLLLSLLHKMNSSSSSNPKLVWLAYHSSGLLTSPHHYPWQTPENTLRYNHVISEFLSAWHVPVFDSFNLTDGTASFDGGHYGLGINRVKVQILLNYILELREKKLW